MSALKPRDVARMLARREEHEPPAGLLEKVKNEIPQELTLRAVPEPPRAPVVPIASRRRRLHTGWLMAAAASVAAAIGAGILAVRVQHETATLTEVAQNQDAAPAPRKESAETRAPSGPPPPAAMPAPEAVTEAGRRKLEQDLKALGYSATEPVQPAEIPAGVEGRVAGGVPGGTPGGVVGGVPGGVVGGIPGGEASEAAAEVPELAEPEPEGPLRIASSEQRKRLAQAPKPASRQAAAAAPAAPAAPTVTGRAELADRADAFSEPAETNPFIDAEEDPLSTFALDVDTGSWAAVRRHLVDGQLPPAGAVRVEEMVNSFDYGDEAPPRRDVAIRIEGAPTPFAQSDRYRLLRINLRARESEQFQLLGRDAKVQVEFNPRAVTLYRLLGYEGSTIADEGFRNDAVAAGDVAAGHNVTALYEIKLDPTAPLRSELATVRLRYRSADSAEVEEAEKSIRLTDLAASWDKASPALRLASVVAEFAEILKGSFWAKDGDLDRLAGYAQRVSAEFAGRHQGADVAEFAALVAKAARLKGK